MDQPSYQKTGKTEAVSTFYQADIRENRYQKSKTAIAVAYDGENDQPRILASGKGALAERIVEEAGQAGVPVHKDTKLANTLSKLQIGEAIPPELYEVVAEVLVFVDQMDRLKSKMNL
ncbi:MAG: flagellar biosynthesis protein FlhB [Lachnospiraceae bacterium]|nr:flagellar biosynthesis protein FlhB [Lachnospiraceae bacterium]